ncbi:hypothetical protein IMZ48_02610 [Candidatus Bathyarchaeota archaeon]|nr:hypothetical protein [Candidatus Bathyarchaeota archaeon]
MMGDLEYVTRYFGVNPDKVGYDVIRATGVTEKEKKREEISQDIHNLSFALTHTFPNRLWVARRMLSYLKEDWKAYLTLCKPTETRNV